jgi:hypothetical protein
MMNDIEGLTSEGAITSNAVQTAPVSNPATEPYVTNVHIFDYLMTGSAHNLYSDSSHWDTSTVLSAQGLGSR